MRSLDTSRHNHPNVLGIRAYPIQMEEVFFGQERAREPLRELNPFATQGVLLQLPASRTREKAFQISFRLTPRTKRRGLWWFAFADENSLRGGRTSHLPPHKSGG